MDGFALHFFPENYWNQLDKDETSAQRDPFNMAKTNSGVERIFTFYKLEFTIINID